MIKLQVAFVLVSALFLTNCGATSGSSSKLGGDAKVDNYSVRWSAVPALQNRVQQGQTPLVFQFSSLGPSSSNGVTEQDWEREAKKRGMGVSDVKSVLFGGSAYKGPDGELRVCTISAIQRGLCGKKLGLSIAKRAEYAQRILAQNGKCRWTGFDPNYHARTAFSLGAEDFTLHVAAEC
ncbi:hypothetical protein JQT66_10345 [Sulfitobacter mediterraneus]|uniref:hypothetical protein n=1 Tax=Sulfitobacter mediterraneus TaxID=83219 RepID=UPI001931D2F2|nr:hypothetical protein [Sulfitobacter mediterraneus]MBM1310567.1 hypothetical protein [Sulfitobacter mediterraneus]MBM1314451.1 hypothetical protein [Sulfitobacter mediterraneus]MBM1322811.1 hypothetical protein [Sulfitobacter mediterraneus]MBM1326723.1 hypothetical protein [Sulfitobacter mediterraneus]MBM1398069.1 hypothetical protein [Sulfitobacter mediterraneus]